MKFSLLISTSWTVKCADDSRWTFDISKGAWWLQLDNIESHIKDSLAEESFGVSVDTFYFGFELTDVAEGLNFEATKGYMSYRPKRKSFITVGQLDWNDFKHLTAALQLELFKQTLLDAVSRIALAKRKPKDFDFRRLYAVLLESMSALSVKHCTGSRDDIDLI
ncbi:hypothetical protein FHR47_001244 [Xanthomonas arboricola]|uniref:hypothetical protein n=1 Tax=Xanthomonas cannabis TaxID=1885674 RepID=UPI00141ACDA8|nr:hypothetical protein [Xanthomonas cannabis]MBB3801010.1 hypothetical protein [Xanthomonas cannabis]MBB3804528.1 hypothetical protein [Xanthomonas cannabis]NIK00470.1 hypothetical protein [Xanthomonas cannabis]NIK63398.1 hypothetical protein [Xanthomonas cannabis]